MNVIVSMKGIQYDSTGVDVVDEFFTDAVVLTVEYADKDDFDDLVGVLTDQWFDGGEKEKELRGMLGKGNRINTDYYLNDLFVEGVVYSAADPVWEKAFYNLGKVMVT